MSTRSGDTFVVAEEPPASCQSCGVVAELRPYGPEGESICFDCGMRDRDTTVRVFRARIEGVDVVIVDAPGSRPS